MLLGTEAIDAVTIEVAAALPTKYVLFCLIQPENKNPNHSKGRDINLVGIFKVAVTPSLGMVWFLVVNTDMRVSATNKAFQYF